MKLESSKILITGATGMVGRALLEYLPTHTNLVAVSTKPVPINTKGSKYRPVSACDLRDRDAVLRLFDNHKPTHVIHLAARVGGIKANMDNMADFYLDNVRINTNVLEAAATYKVEKLLSLLSTCVYPDKVTYPLTEDQIHNGEPHSSNFGYAYAKRMLDVQSRAYRKQYGCNFITAVPNNLFGEHDNFDLENSHVIPAMIRKVHTATRGANSCTFWGTGTPKREFTYSRDLAKIIMFLMNHYDEPTPINVGNTEELSIKELAELVVGMLEYDGRLGWDTKMPDGQFKKPSSNDKLMQLGYDGKFEDHAISLKRTIKWYLKNYPNVRGV